MTAAAYLVAYVFHLRADISEGSARRSRVAALVWFRGLMSYQRIKIAAHEIISHANNT